ncbi:MAG: hypothetical protein ROM03_09320 [Mucispirillum sp.]|nr:hypothetical protein [Mucispirillum sp.]
MKKFILLAGMLLLLAACAENKSSDTGSSYQITGKVIYTADNFKSAKVCVDANNNGLADDADCTETAVDGSYSFTSNNSTNNYPLAASITTANTAVNARLNNGEILMYAPKGKADVISIETTLIKSIMEQNSTKTYDMADAEVAAIMKKTDNKILLTVYTNALNSADIQNWETSIRGIVGAVTNKLLESTEITADTIITVTQEEVDNINNIIKEEDNKEPENPGTEPATPLEKVTEMLAGAEIKNSAENPVNLNEHLDPEFNHYNHPDNQIIDLGIKHDAFGEFNSNFANTFTGVSMLGLSDYYEQNWPSDSPLGFEVFPDDSGSKNYLFSDYPFQIKNNPDSDIIVSRNICDAGGKVNGIMYKPIVSDTEMAVMESDLMQCAKNSGINIDENGQMSQDDINKIYICQVDTWFQHKNNYKIEKWYWTIDTTLLEECK